ncbi:MAG: transposase family protein [Selenomonadaceae bacterium]|nr:transposase family protein [Selenomonadaceae bacterium]
MQEYFSEIQAPRHQGYIKHKLEDILVIIMCAVLCGLDELCTIME